MSWRCLLNIHIQFESLLKFLKKLPKHFKNHWKGRNISGFLELCIFKGPNYCFEENTIFSLFFTIILDNISTCWWFHSINCKLILIFTVCRRKSILSCVHWTSKKICRIRLFEVKLKLNRQYRNFMAIFKLVVRLFYHPFLSLIFSISFFIIWSYTPSFFFYTIY